MKKRTALKNYTTFDQSKVFKEKAKKSVLLNHDNRFIDKMLKQRIKQK